MSKYPIKPGSCHSTAALICHLLKPFGVKVCDGYYSNIDSGKRYRHTFCQYQGKYFDPTIEFAFGTWKLNQFAYESIREYSTHEFLLYTHILGFLNNSSLDTCYYSSTLGNNIGEEALEYMIGDDGFLVSIDNAALVA